MKAEPTKTETTVEQRSLLDEIVEATQQRQNERAAPKQHVTLSTKQQRLAESYKLDAGKSDLLKLDSMRRAFERELREAERFARGRNIRLCPICRDPYCPGSNLAN